MAVLLRIYESSLSARRANIVNFFVMPLVFAVGSVVALAVRIVRVVVLYDFWGPSLDKEDGRLGKRTIAFGTNILKIFGTPVACVVEIMLGEIRRVFALFQPELLKTDSRLLLETWNSVGVIFLQPVAEQNVDLVKRGKPTYKVVKGMSFLRSTLYKVEDRCASMIFGDQLAPNFL